MTSMYPISMLLLSHSALLIGRKVYQVAVPHPAPQAAVEIPDLLVIVLLWIIKKLAATICL